LRTMGYKMGKGGTYEVGRGWGMIKKGEKEKGEEIFDTLEHRRSEGGVFLWY